MRKVSRRKFLKLSGVGALGASSGIAAILKSGTAPAYAQGTTVHWLRLGDFVPASDALFKRELLPEAEKALGLKINFETINGNDLQPRIASADPVGRRRRHRPRAAQLAAALCRERRRRERRGRGHRQGAGRLLRHSQHRHQGRPWLARRAVVRAGHPALLSQVVVRRDRLQQVPDLMGELSRGRQEAQGQGLPDRPDHRPHLQRRARLLLSLPVVVGRQGGRERRQDGRAQQQGDARVGQVHGRLLEGCARRGRARLGRQQQQPRFPRRHHQLDQQRCLNLHRDPAQARSVQDREGHAAEGRHPARALSAWAVRRWLPCIRRSRTC